MVEDKIWNCQNLFLTLYYNSSQQQQRSNDEENTEDRTI